MAAHSLAGLPQGVCERVLQHLDASDVAALACVSKATNARVRASRRWLLMRFMAQPGAGNTSALGEVMRCIVAKEGSAALAASRLVCKAFYRAAYPHVCRTLREVDVLRATSASLRAAQGEMPIMIPSRPRVSFWPPMPPSSDADDAGDE